MKCRIAIIDYKTCNISSVIKAFQNANAEVVVVSNLSEYKNIDKIVLPGVGSFGAASLYLEKTNLDSLIIEQSSQKLVLGICLGMQILALKSEESPNETGLGLIQGVVKKFDISKNNELRVPHMGWNHVEKNNSSLLNNIEEKTDFYFVHSYYLKLNLNMFWQQLLIFIIFAQLCKTIIYSVVNFILKKSNVRI